MTTVIKVAGSADSGASFTLRPMAVAIWQVWRQTRRQLYCAWRWDAKSYGKGKPISIKLVLPSQPIYQPKGE